MATEKIVYTGPHRTYVTYTGPPLTPEQRAKLDEVAARLSAGAAPDDDDDQDDDE